MKDWIRNRNCYLHAIEHSCRYTRPIRDYLSRSEGIESSRVFAKAFRERRCLVPASWYYEWVGEKGSKTPLKIGLKTGEPLMMAGLWEKRKEQDGGPKSACSIVTTEAVGALQELHPRMPLILPPEVQDAWLSPETSQDDLLQLLVPYPDEEIEAVKSDPLEPDELPVISTPPAQ